MMRDYAATVNKAPYSFLFAFVESGVVKSMVDTRSSVCFLSKVWSHTHKAHHLKFLCRDQSPKLLPASFTKQTATAIKRRLRRKQATLTPCISFQT